MAYEIVPYYGNAKILRDYTDIDQKEEARLQELRSKDYEEFGPTGYRASDVFDRKLSFHPINPDHVIKKGMLKKKAPKKLPEISDLFDYYVFSKRIKDVVDSLKHGAHEFFPIKIFRHDQSEFYEYFAVHIGTNIECVAMEESGYHRQFRDDGTSYWNRPSKGEATVLYKDRVVGHHYWRDPVTYKLFFSDEVIAILGDDFMSNWYNLKKVILI